MRIILIRIRGSGAVGIIGAVASIGAGIGNAIDSRGSLRLNGGWHGDMVVVGIGRETGLSFISHVSPNVLIEAGGDMEIGRQGAI